MTDDPEEREWFGLSRKFGLPVAELQARMTDFEFRRHSEDQRDYPDPIDRIAHLMYALTTVVNDFVGAWCDGKRPLNADQIAPWLKTLKGGAVAEISGDEEIAFLFGPGAMASTPTVKVA